MAEISDTVEFVFIAEAGILEQQALLLCESIRRFAGVHARAAVTIVSPRSARRPSPAMIRKFEELQAKYVPVEVESCCPEYGTSYRVHSLALVESMPGPPVIVQLDSDTLFLAEPDLAMAEFDVAARPVDTKGMCTAGPGDPFDDYWRALCALVGITYDEVPLVETLIGAQAVRASYNGGFIVARRSAGLFQRTEDIFRRLVAAGMKPWPCGPVISTGTGLLSGAATAYWGTSQAAFSLAAVAAKRAVRILPETHNFPLHLLSDITRPVPAHLVHIHYHGLFSAGSADENPLLEGKLSLPEEALAWLKARLPLAG
jgi:hypothetical protein